MGTKIALFVVGCLVGGGVVSVLRAGKSDAGGERAPRRSLVTELQSRNSELEEQVEELTNEKNSLLVRFSEARTDAESAHDDVAKLETKVAELEKRCPPKEEPKPTEGPITDAEIMKEFAAFAGRIHEFWTGKAPEAGERLHAFLERGGKQLVKRLMEMYADDSADIGKRAVLAHMLAQSADPDALAYLAERARDPDAGMLEHRLAAHGLAFSPAEGLEPILNEIARKDPDTGARANAAFGLARRGREEGVSLYFAATDEAFENKDPLAIGYLSGFALLEKAALPGVRERLLTYKDPQAVLSLIEIVKSQRDTGALPNLEKLAYDSSQPTSIQKAAQGAIKLIKGVKGEGP